MGRLGIGVMSTTGSMKCLFEISYDSLVLKSFWVSLCYAVTSLSHSERETKSSNSPSSTHAPALFFFLGGLIVLVTLVIILVILWKIIKPLELMKMAAKNKRPPGPGSRICFWLSWSCIFGLLIFLILLLSFAESSDFFSGNIRSISYFDFKILKRATKNFHPENLLGRGGFGPVDKVIFTLNIYQRD